MNPDAAFISNWVRRFPFTPLAALNRLARVYPDLAVSMWFGADSNAYAYGRARPLLERIFPAPVEGEPVFTRAHVPEDGLSPASSEQARRLTHAFRRIVRYGGGRVLVSKRISHNRRIPLLQSVFPEARYVVITRDGRAAAFSMSRVDWWQDGIVWWYGGTPKDWASAGRDPWELCARNWLEEVRAIETGLASVPAPQVLRLRYEDFIERPLEHLRSIADFGGLRVHPQWLALAEKLSYPDRNERWRLGLEPSAAARIEDLQRADLERYGYVTTGAA